VKTANRVIGNIVHRVHLETSELGGGGREGQFLFERAREREEWLVGGGR